MELQKRFSILQSKRYEKGLLSQTVYNVKAHERVHSFIIMNKCLKSVMWCVMQSVQTRI